MSTAKTPFVGLYLDHKIDHIKRKRGREGARFNCFCFLLLYRSSIERWLHYALRQSGVKLSFVVIVRVRSFDHRVANPIATYFFLIPCLLLLLLLLFFFFCSLFSYIRLPVAHSIRTPEHCLLPSSQSNKVGEKRNGTRQDERSQIYELVTLLPLSPINHSFIHVTYVGADYSQYLKIAIYKRSIFLLYYLIVWNLDYKSKTNWSNWLTTKWSIDLMGELSRCMIEYRCHVPQTLSIPNVVVDGRTCTKMSFPLANVYYCCSIPIPSVTHNRLSSFNSKASFITFITDSTSHFTWYPI